MPIIFRQASTPCHPIYDPKPRPIPGHPLNWFVRPIVRQGGIGADMPKGFELPSCMVECCDGSSVTPGNPDPTFIGRLQARAEYLEGATNLFLRCIDMGGQLSAPPVDLLVQLPSQDPQGTYLGIPSFQWFATAQAEQTVVDAYAQANSVYKLMLMNFGSNQVVAPHTETNWGISTEATVPMNGDWVTIYNVKSWT